MYDRKENNRYSECYKKVLYAGPKHFDKLKSEPGLTYDSPSEIIKCGSRVVH